MALDDAIIRRLIDDHGVDAFFTPAERAFIANPRPSDHERLQFGWRSEAARVLFWALGFIEALGLPLQQLTSDEIIEIVEEKRLAGMIADARPRSTSEVLDEADLIYRAHWAARDADLAGKSTAPLDHGVTMERHHALNWLIHYDGQDWDHVTTDT